MTASTDSRLTAATAEMPIAGCEVPLVVLPVVVLPVVVLPVVVLPAVVLPVVVLPVVVLPQVFRYDCRFKSVERCREGAGDVHCM